MNELEKMATPSFVAHSVFH